MTSSIFCRPPPYATIRVVLGTHWGTAMARRGKGLTARKVETAGPGKYEDGQGLRLVVSPGGARKWVFRYMRAGRRVEMGLGSAADVSLAQARERAADARRLVKAGTPSPSVVPSGSAASLPLAKWPTI